MGTVKRIVSVSLGSARRDHAVDAEFLGRRFRIERIGTDGDIQRAIALIRELDGKVDAFGMGGIDLYLSAGRRRYVLRDAKKIAAAARQTPIVDGSGLKNTLERRVIEFLVERTDIPIAHRRVLMVAGVDRFGMSEALAAAGAEMTFGDLVFGLGIPIALHSLTALDLAARVLAPVVTQMPFSMLYPTGDKQERVLPKHAAYYHAADIIAGDFHFIRRYLPERLSGQVVITNTVTGEDIQLLRQRGVGRLVTTTPELHGRSFGTNVLEGVFVVLAGKPVAQITAADYHRLLDQIGLEPRIVDLR